MVADSFRLFAGSLIHISLVPGVHPALLDNPGIRVSYAASAKSTAAKVRVRLSESVRVSTFFKVTPPSNI